MEQHIEPRSRPKVEISGMASTSAEVSDLPIEKTMKRKQIEVKKGEVPMSRVESAGRLPPSLLELLGQAANDDASSYSFKHMLTNYLVSESPEESGSGEKASLEETVLVNPGKRQTSAISENLTSQNFQETKNLSSSPRVGDDELLVLSSEKAFPSDHNKHHCDLQVPLKSFDTLLHPLDSTLGREEHLCYLKSPALGLIREESPEHIPTESPDPGAEAGEQRSRPEGEPKTADLRAFSSESNNLQVSLFDCRSPKPYSMDSQQEFFEVNESKTVSPFPSAVSLCTLQAPSPRRPIFLDFALPLKSFKSLTRISEKSVEVRKSKSENNVKSAKAHAECGTKFSTAKPEPLLENPNDSYEKILPFISCETKKAGRGGSVKSEFLEKLHRNNNEMVSQQDRRTWSPTLPELTEIYENILKESKRMKRNKPHRCFSTYLLRRLKETLKEKRLRMDLVDFSKNFRDTFTPKNWKPGKVEDPSYGLTEYVAMVQQILHSNLSVKQIASLNNTLMEFQDIHEFTHRLLENENIEDKKGKDENPEETQTKKLEPSTSGEIAKFNLIPPTELETLLRSFNFENLNTLEDNSKLMATVKLCGNQILVSSLTYFINEKTLMIRKKKEEGTSELIIENLTKKQNFEEKSKICSTKKPVTPLAKNKAKLGNLRDQQKEPPEFHYDQIQLRVQHPIEAIVESPESKVEDTERSDIVRDEVSPAAIKKALQEALAGKIYLRDLFHELGRTEEEIGKTMNCVEPYGNRPQAKRRPSSPKKNQAETVKSTFHLKKSLSGKTPKVPRSTYLCYPSVMSLQNDKTAKKKIKDRSRYLGSPTPTTSSFKMKQTTHHPNKWEAGKQRGKVEPNVNQQTSETEAMTSGEEQLEAVKSGISPPEEGGVSECSIELLMSDVSGTDVAPALKKSQDRPTENPPVLLHCSKSTADGTSFRSEIIHSDSYLKYCTPLRVTQSRLKSLFKCNSDIKFYPGRVNESSEDQEPFITFVLTPRQKEEAKLPERMVQIVQKDKAAEPPVAADVPSDPAEPAAPAEEQKPKEGSLEAVEKFIEELANLRRTSQRQRQREIQRKPPPKTVKFDRNTRPFTVQGSEISRPQERKAYHECQKRKLWEKQNSQGNASRFGAGGKLKQPPKRTVEPRKSDVALDNVVKKTCLVFSDLFRTKYLEMQRTSRREMEDKATEMRSSESKLEVVGPDIHPEGNTEKEDDNLAIIPNDLLGAIKFAIGQLEGFDSKEKIIAAIVDWENKRTRKEDVTNFGNSWGLRCPPNAPKKSKTVKIKIRCRGLKQVGERRKEEKEENLEETKQEPEEQPKYPVNEIELLDSLVSTEPVGAGLTKKNSTYFDALEKNLESEGTGEDVEKRVGDARKMSLPTLEAVPNQESCSEAKSNPSLTPSDERLLNAVSFEKETEEIVYRKISKYLEDGNVSYSMTLLDGFLKKTENSFDDVDSRIKLNDLLSLVENKSQNLMRDMERNAWLKVLSLLEEASRVLENESVNHSKKAQLLEKIKSLNIRRLVELQNGRFSLESFSQSVKMEDGRTGNFLGMLRESLSFLRRKVAGKGSGVDRTFVDWEEALDSSESTIRVHSTDAFPEMCEDLGGLNAKYLKSKLQQQKERIEKLMNANDSLCTSKAVDLRNIVMMKMKSLENVMERLSMGECSKGSPWSLGSGCRKADDLCRRTGYVDLVRYFMKAWDARMSLSSLSNCRI